VRFCSFSQGEIERFGVQLVDSHILDLPGAGKALRDKGKLSETGAELLSSRDLKSWLCRGRVAITVAQEIERAVSATPADAEEAIFQPDEIRLQPPITNPGKLIGIGLNYKDHAEELKVPAPESPLMFAKFSNTLAGPEDEIKLPAASQQVDPEAELCVVMLEGGNQLSEEQAQKMIGYMVGNDVSARDLQFSDGQWVRGKSCDTFAPCGPFLVTEDEVGDPHQLDIELRLNGSVQQSSNTRNLIFDCFSLVSYISKTMTLETGDIIFTGTPAGVGVFRDPPVFLQSGDVVEVTIEKLGTLRNTVN